jgi:murein DD-endopeptidase MepM/ murein hydrolase activator NlpD
MATAFDNLENEALRFGAGVPAGTKWRNLSSEQKNGFDNYMRTKIRRNPEAFANDTRASKYLKDYDQSTFDALRQQELNDSVKPGGIWDDFGAGGGGLDSDFGDMEGLDQSEETQDREKESGRVRDDDEPEKNDDNTGSTDDEDKSPKDQPTEAEEPGIGEDASAKAPKEPGGKPPAEGGPAPKTVPGLGDAKAAGNAAKAAGSTAEAGGVATGAGGAAAGAAGAGEAAAVTATAGAAAPEFLIVLMVLGVIFLVIIALWGLAAQNPGSAESAESVCVSVDGHVFPLPKDQVTYSDGFGDSRTDHLHSGTDIMHKKDLKVEVYAITDGDIVSAKTGTSGASLKLRSTNPNGTRYYFYTHFSSINVTSGASVKAGQLIGYSGGYNEGANGDHIHLSVGTVESFTVNLPLGSGAAHGQTAAPSPYESTLNPFPILKAIDSGSTGCVGTSVGQYGLPVDAGVGFILGSGFGPRTKPCDTCSSNHKGQDISIPGTADVGKPVYSVEAGKITSAYYSSCALYKVTIDHGNGFVTKYYHLTKGGVGGLATGSTVTKGQQIGTISSSAGDTCSTGPHLHFETWIGGVAKNPVGIVDFSKL